jgi:hypothetical protein
MITLGLDPHSASHTVVALDESGISLEHLTVPNTAEGLTRMCEFSCRREPARSGNGRPRTRTACSIVAGR